MCNRTVILLLSLAAARPVRAQHVRDTLAVIREFNDVMSFAVQPYVSYRTTTSLPAGSFGKVPDDGTPLHGKFYKCGEEFYYGTEAEEMFVQDSLMIRVDHHRKAITIQRIEASTRKNIDVLPLRRVDRQQLLRNRYLISEVPAGGDTGVITFRSRETMTPSQLPGGEMRLEYTKANHLPLLMALTLHGRQAGSETAVVRFEAVSLEKEQALPMPRWTQRLHYDGATGQFAGTGAIAEYTVTKTF